MAAVGIVLFAGFAYLVTHSKNRDVKRRWRFSIFWGVTSGALLSILFGLFSVLALFADEKAIGYMEVFRSIRSPMDLIAGIVLFIVYPVLIGLPFAFLITIGTYWRQLGMGDLFINQLLYPVKKHPSDQSPDSIIDRLRTFIAKFID